MPTLEELQQEIADLRELVTRAQLLAFHHAAEHTDLGQDPITQQSVTGHGHDEIRDRDDDTGWRAEQSTDEDILRARTAGTERFRVEADGNIQGSFIEMIDIAAVMVQATEPSTPATGQLWLDTSTDGTGMQSFTLVTKTAAYTATDSDTVIICDATISAFSITLPSAVNRPGKVYYIKKIDSTSNVVTIDGDGVETIDDGETAPLTVQYEALTIVSDGAEWFIL